MPSDLSNSQSVGSFEERIRRERRRNPLAPSLRLSGPSRFVQSKLFAQPRAPTEIVEEPIVVKVRYDPSRGEKPSEEFVRQLIDRQLKLRGNSDEPIIVNCLDRAPPPPPRPIIYRPAYTPLPRPILPSPFSVPGTTKKVMAQAARNLPASNTSNDVYRPSAVTDVPELSRDNLLSMLK